ncbi:MAG: hypothetical protein H0X69_05005 [Gemmatimonadales bacterium]|nr:hypothetical protein [Gemmatimonadales bacterium]
MPPDVRRAYLDALRIVRDSDPDVAFDGSRAVIDIRQASVAFNRRPIEGPSPSNEPPSERVDTGELDPAQRTVGVLLAFVAGFTVIFAVGLMVTIGGGREHLAGRLSVAVAALIVLGWLDTQATRLARRRQPVLAPDSAGYRRFAVWSSLGLLLTAALLLGLAWFLP